YDLAAEQVGVVVELGEAVDLHVGRHGPADVGALEVGPEVHEAVLRLLPVRGVRRRQPGGHDRVEIALGEACPHRSGVDGRQLDVVAELVHQHGGDDVRGGDLGVPEHVAEVDRRVLGGGGT